MEGGRDYRRSRRCGCRGGHCYAVCRHSGRGYGPGHRRGCHGDAAAETNYLDLLIGTGAGIAAGLYWGAKQDAEWQEVIERIKAVSNQLDIYFEPAAENKGQAADFRCTLVIYEETDLKARPPVCTERHVKIEAADSEEFYRLIDQQLKAWLHKPVLADQDNKSRRVKIYMRPYPGEGVYERLRQLVDNNGIRNCVVERSEQSWTSARPAKR